MTQNPLPGDAAEVRVGRRAVLATAAVTALASPFAGPLLAPTKLPGARADVRADPATEGSWSAPFAMGGVAIHATVTHVGDVMFFGRVEGNWQVDRTSYVATWSYLTQTAREAPLPYDRDIFCAHQNVLPDGRVYVTGGHTNRPRDPDGVRNTDIYNPATRTWTPSALMTQARWYPTNVGLGNGRALIFGGQIAAGNYADTVEEFNPATGTMRTLPASATRRMGLYPRLHLVPNGTVLRTGPQRQTLRFNPATSAWTAGPSMLYGNRNRGISVLLPGAKKILTAGGHSTGAPTGTAEVLDTAAPTLKWTATGSMKYPRLLANAVLLPDGTVFVVGGGQTPNYTGPVFIPEVYDPATGTWTPVAPHTASRMYHATALLLPDGRVLVAGQDNGGLATYGELYSPPYLFRGARPTISAAPATAGWNVKITVTTPDAADIGSVMLIRPGTVTHQVNTDQRALPLAFTAGVGALSVTTPLNRNTAPPGYYLLFVVNRDKVPSVAKWVRLG